MSGTITNLFYQMRHGDQDAASDLLNHFLPRLKNQLQRTTSNLRIHDEDDIAVSAFYQFCKAVEKSRFRDISDRTELWRVLWMFASYQANDCRKNESAKFRGGDSNIVSVNLLKAELGRFDNRPDLQLELIDECDRLLGSIEDSKLRNVAELKLHGYTNQEIAQMMGVAKRTVQNMLNAIKEKMKKRFGRGFAA